MDPQKSLSGRAQDEAQMCDWSFKYETIRHSIITEVKLTAQGRQCCSLGAVRAEGGRSREAKAELRSRPWHKITSL